jgi:hypothetical protein
VDRIQNARFPFSWPEPDPNRFTLVLVLRGTDSASPGRAGPGFDLKERRRMEDLPAPTGSPKVKGPVMRWPTYRVSDEAVAEADRLNAEADRLDVGPRLDRRRCPGCGQPIRWWHHLWPGVRRLGGPFHAPCREAWLLRRLTDLSPSERWWQEIKDRVGTELRG